ncbi:MAG: hypothetical protein ABIW76_21790 [Fibrobacteria bacterium]
MKIRKLCLTFLMTACIVSAEETLLKSGELKSGGFGGPVVKISQVNGEAGVLVGGRGGWLINSVFSIGGGGYGLVNDIHADHPDSMRIDLGVGGLILEAVFMPQRLVHGTASVLVGAGGLNRHRRMRDDSDDGGETFFALEPEVNLEINVHRIFRVCSGLSYRWLAGESDFVDSDWDLSGISVNLTFKFGRF